MYAKGSLNARLSGCGMQCKAREEKEKPFGKNGGLKVFLKKKGAKMQIFQKTGVLGSPGMQVEGLHAILQA